MAELQGSSERSPAVRNNNLIISTALQVINKVLLLFLDIMISSMIICGHLSLVGTVRRYITSTLFITLSHIRALGQSRVVAGWVHCQFLVLGSYGMIILAQTVTCQKRYLPKVYDHTMTNPGFK